MFVSTSLEELAYDAALRSLDKQEHVLDEIRARTGLLVGGSSLAASFLGPRAFTSGHTAILVAALATFAFTIVAGLYVLMPKKNLCFRDQR